MGLGVDYVASVRQAGAGDSWEPERLWNYYTGGSDLDPVVTVSEMTMADFLAELAAGSGVQGRDGGVRFDHQRVEVVKPRPGRTIDPQQAQEAITAAYLSEDPTAHIDLVPSAPAIDEADVREAVQTFANPAMSGSRRPRPRGPVRCGSSRATSQRRCRCERSTASWSHTSVRACSSGSCAERWSATAIPPTPTWRWSAAGRRWCPPGSA